MKGKDLLEIAAREIAATLGPWGAEADFHGIVWHPGGEPVVQHAMPCDAEFIAHARQDVPALTAEVRRLVGVVRTLASVAEECAQDADRHDVDDNIKRQLTPIHAAVADARAAVAGYEDGAEAEVAK